MRWYRHSVSLSSIRCWHFVSLSRGAGCRILFVVTFATRQHASFSCVGFYPVNTTLEALSRTVIVLQHKLHPPSHYGLGSEASTSVDVATPPSAFWWPGHQLPSMSRAPPSPFAELGTHSSSIPCFCWAWSCTIASSTIPIRAHVNRSKAQFAATILFRAGHNYRSRPGGY